MNPKHECISCHTSGGVRNGKNKNYEAYYKCKHCGQGWAEPVICQTCFGKYNYENYCSEPWAHAKIAERFYLIRENDTYKTEFRKRIMHSNHQHEERFKAYRDQDYWDRLGKDIDKAETEAQD